MHATNHDTTHSQSHTDHTDHITDNDDDALVKFIPKPNIQALHGDIRNFMLKQLRTNTETRRRNKASRDPFEPKRNYNPNPERLSDNGTLDTFLHQIRTEMLNVNEYKQNKQDNLTRKERITLRDLKNPNIIINKADKGSTIVVEDREDYIRNAMSHLNDPTVYKPLSEDVSPMLKQLIIEKLKLLKTNGLIKKTWFEFCKPSENARTS